MSEVARPTFRKKGQLACPLCRGLIAYDDIRPEIILPVDPPVKIVSATFEFPCPHCRETLHMHIPSESGPKLERCAPVIPIRQR